jgi:hypothetical protein
VIVIAPTFEDHPIVFDSREVARTWAAETDWAHQFNWDSLSRPLDVGEKDTLDLTVQYFQLALEKRLPLDSPKLFEHARKARIVNSLACHPLADCTGYPHVPTPGKAVELPWPAYSCQSSGWSDLWDASGQQLCALRGEVACEPIPLGATSAYTS